jgi:hypothetical protein
VYQPGFFVFEHLQGDHLLALAAAAFADNMSVFSAAADTLASTSTSTFSADRYAIPDPPLNPPPVPVSNTSPLQQQQQKHQQQQ